MDKRKIGGLVRLSLDKAKGEVEISDTRGRGAYSEIAVEKIHPDPEQPRKEFSDESLRSMAETIKQVGVLIPLTVEHDPASGGYKIITGERRYRAAKIAGLEKVPCVVREIDNERRLLHQLIENLQKEDLNPPFEKAKGIQLLMHRFNYTQRDVARALGKKESTISEDLSVLKSPEDVQQKLLRAEVPKRTAVLIAAEKDPKKQRELAERVVKQEVTSEDIRREKRKNSLNPFVYESEDGRFTVTVEFRKTKVTMKVLLGALGEAYKSVKRSSQRGWWGEDREENYESHFNENP